METVGIIASEPVLIERAIAGDCDAFGELYEHYLDPVYRFIYFRTGDPRDAEDLTEQVFIRAWQALPGYKDTGSSIACWLYRIAHNLIVDYHRLKAKYTAAPLDDGENGLPIDLNLLKQVIDAEEAAALARAVSKLNEEQQQVILLRFVEGLSHTEVARILEKSEGACRMLQTRALVTLQRLMSGLQGTTK